MVDFLTQSSPFGTSMGGVANNFTGVKVLQKMLVNSPNTVVTQEQKMNIV